MRPLVDPVIRGEGRAFIVGNGKSLEADQLDQLKNEVTFAVNRIHLIYNKTSWRPTYWITTDLDGTKAYVHDIPLHTKQGYRCFVRCDIMARCVVTWLGSIPDEELLEMIKNVSPLDAVNNIMLEERRSREPWIDFKYNEGGSIGAAQQLALAWGYDPVYMVGCEGGLEARENNHFDEDYADYTHDNRNPLQIEAANDLLQITDEIALREYQARSRKIYNATVGGSKRNAIPETDFWRLFDD